MKTSLVRLLVAFVAILIIVGCKEKKEEKVILTNRPVEVVKNDTIKMEDVSNATSIKWRGAEYKINIKRSCDCSLAITEDEDENKYYDNRVVLKIEHTNGSVFLEKQFVKADFKNIVSEDFFDKKALVGFVFDKVDGNNLRFAASIGSPDKFSDDFIPFDVLVTPSGEVSLKLSEQTLVDNSSDDKE